MAEQPGKQPKGTAKGYTFGTFKGVFTPSVLTILGVVMYLRLGWVLGSVGLAKTLLIVSMATSITFLTGLSLSALATNARPQRGGSYFFISRSLGVETGAAVGLPLFIAQALGIAFYVAGFSESVAAVFPLMHPRWVGVVTLVILALLAGKSADLALKIQFVVMSLIVLSLVSLFMGSGASLPTTGAATAPVTRKFWVVFAVFFPAVTGIESGLAMSGDLKNPGRSLPLGSIGAIVTGFFVYMIIPVFLWYTVTDKSLLLTQPLIMRNIARWGDLIILGVWAASLSSAMGALLAAPRTLQALARDRVIPPVFGRGFGKGNDPRVATGLTFAISLVGVLIGDMNVIAPVLTMFFLTSYGLLNVSAGIEELASPPSWRPTFRVPWNASLLGALACLSAMLMINTGATFVAVLVASGIYFTMERRSMRARWGDMRNAILMLIARAAMTRLARRKIHERTWRPNILVLSGSPTSRWHLIELAGAISHDRGFLTVAAVLPEDTSEERAGRIAETITQYLDKQGVSAFVKVYPAPTPLAGARVLVQTYGYGPVAPNTVLVGETDKPENYHEFANLILGASRQRQNVIVVREPEKETETMKPERIDVWWYGTQQNLGLMLALVHLLKRSATWRKTQLTLKSVATDEAKGAETRQRLESFIRNVRIDAKADVTVSPPDDIFEFIRERSGDADLVLLGIRAPRPDETPEEYSTYYAELLARSRGLPAAVFVMAAEDIDFRAIFREK
ncbi:MAG: amino acid permease [Lentisphaerae bacterium]|nr:amino acid permease [Lentisphaerota bacterium]